MHKKIWLLLGSIFLGIGIFIGVIAIIVSAAISSQRNRVMRDAIPVTAVIVDIRPWHDDSRVYIEYEVDGEVFTAQLNWSSSRMYVGQSIEIYVSRHNPRQFVSTGMMPWLPVMIISIFPIVFGGIGAGFLIHHARNKKRHRWLLEFGTPVWANVLGLDDNWSIRVNGRPATVLVASYGNMRFVSGPLDNNDLMHMRHVGEHVKVLIHPDNSNRYTFDFKNESYLTPFEPPKPLQEGAANGQL